MCFGLKRKSHTRQSSNLGITVEKNSSTISPPAGIQPMPL